MTNNLFKRIFLNLFLIISLAQYTLGQQNGAAIYTDSLGQVFVQANMPAYFFIAPDTSKGSRILIPSKDPKSNPMYFDGNGVHYVRTQDGSTNKSIIFKIYADGVAPRIKLHFKNGVLINSGKRFYVDSGSKADIIANDNLSGVRAVFVSIDGSEFGNTKTILFDKRNDYQIKSYAVDNVGNVSDTLQFRVITAVDSIVKINNIYFDINSSRLRDDSKTELNDFIQVLNEYPELKIELRAHTDCIGDAAYNMLLSERRAESVLNYLVYRGINRSRLTFKGFGDTSPVNECVKGVTCPEAKHQENRRVEFRILPIK